MSTLVRLRERKLPGQCASTPAYQEHRSACHISPCLINDVERCAGHRTRGMVLMGRVQAVVVALLRDQFVAAVSRLRRVFRLEHGQDKTDGGNQHGTEDEAAMRGVFHWHVQASELAPGTASGACLVQVADPLQDPTQNHSFITGKIGLLSK